MLIARYTFSEARWPPIDRVLSKDLQATLEEIFVVETKRISSDGEMGSGSRPLSTIPLWVHQFIKIVPSITLCKTTPVHV